MAEFIDAESGIISAKNTHTTRKELAPIKQASLNEAKDYTDSSGRRKRRNRKSRRRHRAELEGSSTLSVQASAQDAESEAHNELDKSEQLSHYNIKPLGSKRFESTTGPCLTNSNAKTYHSSLALQTDGLSVNDTAEITGRWEDGGRRSTNGCQSTANSQRARRSRTERSNMGRHEHTELLHVRREVMELRFSQSISPAFEFSYFVNWPKELWEKNCLDRQRRTKSANK